MEDWGITRVVKHYDLDRVRLGAERSARASPRVGRAIHDLDAARLTDAVTGLVDAGLVDYKERCDTLRPITHPPRLPPGQGPAPRHRRSPQGASWRGCRHG